jgi:hypothetical protein
MLSRTNPSLPALIEYVPSGPFLISNFPSADDLEDTILPGLDILTRFIKTFEGEEQKTVPLIIPRLRIVSLNVNVVLCTV